MPPILALLLAIGLTAGSAPDVAALPVVPDEPEAVLLPERPTLQAVAADLAGDGSRELVRLVAGERGSALIEVWSFDGTGWSRVGSDVEAVPELSGGNRFDVAYDTTPARLVVRDAGSRERVTLVRQPHFEPPGLEPLCCLQLHELDVTDNVALRAVGSAPEAVDAILALDMDGDGVDELLASRSLRPIGRTAYPSEALVFRWDEGRGRFTSPTLTELPIGSGDTPFVLGDSDGLPGEEAAIITTAAQGVLYRLVLDDGDRVRAESAGAVVDAVAVVPLDDGPGVALIGPVAGTAVHPWPPGEELGRARGRLPATDGRILGAHDMGTPMVYVEREDGGAVEALRLPALEADDDAARPSGAAGAAREATALEPYRGPLPGGGPDGAPAMVVDGLLLEAGRAPSPIVALADAEPIGFLGPERGWLAIAHGSGPLGLDPAGGRLEPVGLPPTARVSIVPADLVAGERDGGRLDPEVRDAVVLDDEGTLGIAASGFGVAVEAPAGSRVHTGLGDGGRSLGEQIVPASGRLSVQLPLPRAVLPYAGDRAWLAVVTPAGATYVATWSVLALTGPPLLEATTDTPIGSTAVEVRGRTVPYATVTVDGVVAAVDGEGGFRAEVALPPWPTPVEVSATDPFGNVARTTLSGVGLFDYRRLPWIPITIAALGIVAAVLYVRVPRASAAASPRHDDDASVEELDPEREP